ncbi:hypothetical protein L1085_000670 [Streptomyces sp. MSC1_001]|uniref:hypothetical protein n=1 Tax=Streptomyces sp. MSC1_001 TaxID=2909263 RepID=UPI00202F8258|nr:hypothetical protein [Streptomyces sp. MSC1_001]
MALASLGDERALPSLLTALDTGTDAWRAVNAAGHLPQAAAELAPRLARHLADADFSGPWHGISAPALASALSALGDPVIVPELTDTVRAAVRHKQWSETAYLLKAIAMFGTRAESALDIVRPLTDVEDVALCTAATGALWELERSPERVVPLLERLLDHNRNFDAIDLAGRVGPPAAAVLSRLRQILNEQVEQNARNEQKGSAVLNDSWTLVHAASALWDIGGDGEAGIVVPALLNAWKNNGATARAAAACLDLMGPAARPAVLRIQAALEQPHRSESLWSGGVAFDLELQRSCRAVLTRLQDLPDHTPAEPTDSPS